ncbi:MAG: LLM class flavin-dependent oxidoreductase [Acetobacteraceae bacterium]|nr:LLM class flavin-dependent oxidoreductase [Acetobacteraceae bacterium]
MTKWGIFSLSQIPDQSQRAAAFEADLGLFALAEDLGYHSVWIAEHLFSTYGVVTSTQVYAAAIAERTHRIRIGTAVVVVPFNHPLRTASDFALVDILSRGRLDFGVGRAYQPHEFVGLGVPMEHSREMFNEGMDVILKAWTEERMSHAGRFWSIPAPVDVLPKPIQRPHPPIYQATVSPESFDQAARRGWNLQLASPFTYRTYRERWIDELAAHLGRYETQCVQYGRDPKQSERMILVPFFVGETASEAQEIFARHVEWFYAKVTANQLLGAPPGEAVKGYELTMSEGRRTREMGYLSFEKLHQHRAAIADDPDTCVDKLRDLKQRLGITEFCLWFNIGGIDPKLAARSMRLAAERVIPHI